MAFHDAGTITKSDWLQHFAYGGVSQDYDPSIFQVIKMGIWDTFIFGKAHLNSNLWTMKFEYFGSLIVYTIVLLRFNKKASTTFVLIVFLALLSCNINVYYMTFVVGTLLSFIHPKINSIATIVFLMVLGIYLFGYYHDQEHYEYFGIIFDNTLEKRIIIMTIASALIITSALQMDVKNFYVNRAFQFLGRISFPLYLVHTLVICSFSSIIFVQLQSHMSYNWAVITSFFVTCLILVPLVFIFVKLDGYGIQLSRYIESKIQ
jgi:peptidoglycan/LPS O-acetylase OafA/YrhL